MANRLSTEDIQLNITLKSNKAMQELGELDQRAARLREEMKGLTKGTQEYASKSKELSQVNTRMEELRKEVGLTALSMKQLNERARELRMMKQHLTPGTQEFKKVDAELTKVNARLKEVRNGSQLAGRSLAQSAGGIRTAWVGATAVIYGLFHATGRFVQAFRDEVKAINKVQQAIISTSGAAGLSLRELRAEAEKLQSQTVYADDDILNNVTTQLLTFTNIANDNFKRAQVAAMDLATVLDGDLKSSSIMLGKALNDPVQGLTAMRRVGIAFTEDQTSTIRSLAETNRLAEAQALILDELARQYGGQARAAVQGAGAMDQVRNKMGMLEGTIGKMLTAGILPLYRWFGNLSERLDKDISGSLKTVTETFDEQLDKVTNLQIKIVPLLDRYDELSLKANLSTIEQTELENIIDTISKTIPAAVTQFDEYGKAIGISTERVKDYIATEKAYLQYTNKDRIAETKKAIEGFKKEMDELRPTISQIETTGTFKVLRNETDMLGKSVKRWGEATEEEIRKVQDEYSNLGTFIKGAEENLSRMSGDALEESIRRREEDLKAARELEEKRVEYRKKSTEELKRLAGEGDQLAIDTLAQLGDEGTITETVYAKLTKAINQGKEALTGFVAEGNYLAAEQQAAALKVLESQKSIIDKIIEAGGTWDKFVNKLREDEFSQLMKRNEAALQEFVDVMSISTDQDLDSLLNDLDTANNKQLESFQKIGKKSKEIPQEWKDAWEDFAQIGSDAVFSIIKNNQQSELDEKLSTLQKKRDAELSNDKLTAEERQKINEKYRKKEAKIKEDAYKKQKAADIVQAIINTALAVSKALGSAPPPANAVLAALAGVAGAAQVAVIAAQKVPQFALGRYDVIGQNDNRLYRQVPFLGEATTGMFRKPALVAEKGDELIIDNPTLRRLRVNFPEVLSAINHSRIPQYSTGRYPDNVNSPIPGPTISQQIEFDYAANTLMKAAQIFQEASTSLRRDGVTGKWYLQDFEEINLNKSKIENKSKI